LRLSALQSVVPTADLDEGFRDINWALLVGSIPRKAGMVDKDLISSFPVRVRGGKWEIVQNVPINEFSRAKIDASVNELREEKNLAMDLLG
jgi:malate/lactate dehydrogenase